MDLSLLKTLRKQKGVTLKDMSRSIGVSSDRLGLIERGKVNPSFETVKAIVEYLGYKLTVSIVV